MLLNFTLNANFIAATVTSIRTIEPIRRANAMPLSPHKGVNAKNRPIVTDNAINCLIITSPGLPKALNAEARIHEPPPIMHSNAKI
ncbi:hypothetical protein D3C73_1471920 [compost metagenome]